MSYRKFWDGFFKTAKLSPALREAIEWLDKPSAGRVVYIGPGDFPPGLLDPSKFSDEMVLVGISPWGFVFEPRRASDPGG